MPDWVYQAVLTGLSSYVALRVEIKYLRRDVDAIAKQIKNCPQKCAALVRIKT